MSSSFQRFPPLFEEAEYCLFPLSISISLLCSFCYGEPLLISLTTIFFSLCTQLVHCPLPGALAKKLFFALCLQITQTKAQALWNSSPNFLLLLPFILVLILQREIPKPTWQQTASPSLFFLLINSFQHKGTSLICPATGLPFLLSSYLPFFCIFKLPFPQSHCPGICSRPVSLVTSSWGGDLNGDV